jgi:excisionase family DNA binding protein
MDRLFCLEEAAAYLGGISVHTVKKMLARHQLRRTKIGRRTFIRQSQLQRVMKDEFPAAESTQVLSLQESQGRSENGRAVTLSEADPRGHQ